MKLLNTILLFALLSGGAVQAQTVAIGGELPKPYSLTATRFAAMKQISVKAKGHDGKEHEYSGVYLWDILTKGGLVLGKGSKVKTVNSYVTLTARDQYKAVIAMAEIDTAFNVASIILANKVDGKSLAENGPYQLIVPNEKKFGRWVRQVTAIKFWSLK